MATCTICFDLLTKGLCVTDCGHVYHRMCLERWVSRKMNCPICKDRLTNSRIRKLHLEPLDIARELIQDPDKMQDLDPEEIARLQLNKTTKTKSGSGGEVSSFEVNRLRQQANTLQERLTRAEGAGTRLMEELEKSQGKEDKLNRKIEKHRQNAKACEEGLKAKEIQVFKLTRETNSLRTDFVSLKKQQKTWQTLEDLKNGKERQSIDDMIAGKSDEDAIVFLLTQLTYFKREYHILEVFLKERKERTKQDMTTKQEIISSLSADLQMKREDLHDEKRRLKLASNTNRGLKSEVAKLKTKLAAAMSGRSASLPPGTPVAEDDRRQSLNSNSSEASHVTGTTQASTSEPSTPALFRVPPSGKENDPPPRVPQPGRNSSSSSFFSAMNKMENKRRNPFGRSKSNGLNRNSKILRGGDGRGGSKTFVNSFGKKRLGSGRSGFAKPNKRQKMGKGYSVTGPKW